MRRVEPERQEVASFMRDEKNERQEGIYNVWWWEGELRRFIVSVEVLVCCGGGLYAKISAVNKK